MALEPDMVLAIGASQKRCAVPGAGMRNLGELPAVIHANSGNTCRRHDGHSKICKIRANWWIRRGGAGAMPEILKKNQQIARIPVLAVFFRLRARSICFAPGCPKGIFCLHAKMPKVLHLSYFNGAKAKKFRDWRRVENEHIRLPVALTGIKMTVCSSGTRGAFCASAGGRSPRPCSRGKKEVAGCPACS